MEVMLKPVTVDNWYACSRLKVKEEQLAVFPAPVVNWIAEAKYVHEFELIAIYCKEELVGFIVYCPEPDQEGNCWIPAVMIDGEHQGKGYARAALKQLIDLMSPASGRIMIGHRPENHAAAALYESLGFKKVSEELIDGEIVRLLQVG